MFDDYLICSIVVSGKLTSKNLMAILCSAQIVTYIYNVGVISVFGRRTMVEVGSNIQGLIVLLGQRSKHVL